MTQIKIGEDDISEFKFLCLLYSVHENDIGCIEVLRSRVILNYYDILCILSLEKNIILDNL